LAATQYVERYLYSPYASQFADAFVSGVIAMHEAISQDKLADITAMMDAEREKVIYLRIARRAAIDGLTNLSTFASAKAEQGRGGKTNDDDPRALLYASLSTVTSATVDAVGEKLKTIDRDRLSENDRSLLDAARAVVREMVAKPTPAQSAPPLAQAGAAAPAEQVPMETDLPPVEGIAGDVPTTPMPVEAAVKDAAIVPDPTDTAIAATRHTLESIDQMLGVSPK
jgi:chemotaxis protein MotC